MLSALYSHFSDFLWKSKIAGTLNLADLYKKTESLFQQAGFREKSATVPDSVLVLRPDVGGDNILTTPLLRELRRNAPQAFITLMTSSTAHSFMELCPYVDEVLAFPSASLKKDTLQTLQDILDFSKEHFWKRNYDTCLLPQWPFPTIIYSRMLAYFSGARERWGYSDTVQNLYAPMKINPTNETFLLNHILRHPPEIIHEADRNLYLLEAMGMTITDRHTELWTSIQDQCKAEDILSSWRKNKVNKIITLSTGAGGNSRKYPVTQWLPAMKKIIKMDGRFILIGGPTEVNDNAFLEAHLPAEAVKNLTGETSLRESVALIAASDLFMGNDSGMMHAAAACNRPIIAVYREALDKENQATGLLSEFRRFEPYMADYIVLRPEHALEGCKDVFCYGGCDSAEAHCICQVKPEEIVEAYRIMKER